MAVGTSVITEKIKGKIGNTNFELEISNQETHPRLRVGDMPSMYMVLTSRAIQDWKDVIAEAERMINGPR